MKLDFVLSLFRVGRGFLVATGCQQIWEVAMGKMSCTLLCPKLFLERVILLKKGRGKGSCAVWGRCEKDSDKSRDRLVRGLWLFTYCICQDKRQGLAGQTPSIGFDVLVLYHYSMMDRRMVA